MTIGKSETELWIRLATGSEIWVLGFDKPERFEGSPWHGGILDEYADMKPEVWPESVLPALTDTQGWCWLAGVPNGKNHYYELVERARSGQFPDWKDYNWCSADVLDPMEMEHRREDTDPRTFRQEYEGSFESYEGRAYTYYNADTHRKAQKHVPSLPVCITCDFNLDPCIWVVGQDLGGFVSVQSEIVQRQTDIWKMCNATKELLARLAAPLGKDAERRRKTIFYGDLEHGNQRSVSATATSWTIIKEEFKNWNVELRLRSHPRIVDRVNAVNSRLRNARGEIRFGVDPSCIQSHKDFEMVEMADLQNAKKEGDRTHASDGIGYWINYEYPIVRRAATLN